MRLLQVKYVLAIADNGRSNPGRGLAVGIGGAWLAGYLIANRLYEVSPVDPATWITTSIVLVLVVLEAGLWPAERAARIQPTEALHHE